MESIKLNEENFVGSGTISIYDIIPDVKQPRRVIPLAVRDLVIDWWLDIEVCLNHWHAIAEERYGKQIAVHEGIMADGDWSDVTGYRDGLVEGFFDLMSLASSILQDGLTNPITVVKMNRKYIIETGERRWLAHQLMAMYAFEDYKQIPARVVDGFDVFRQAAENGRRQPLNAIGKARQVGLLLMELHKRDVDPKWATYDFLVKPGQCDRPFYAQAANGDDYPIPRGQGQRLLDVTGITSMTMLRKYRALLKISDEMWREADEENLSEGNIRKRIEYYRVVKRVYSHTTDAVLSEHAASPQVTPSTIDEKQSEQLVGAETINEETTDKVPPPSSWDEIDASIAGLPVDEYRKNAESLLDGQPAELRLMLDFLRAMARVKNEHLLVTKLAWLIDMSRDDMRVVVEHNGMTWLAGWLEQVNADIDDVLNMWFDEFEGQMKVYSEQLSEIAGEVLEGGSDVD